MAAMLKIPGFLSSIRTTASNFNQVRYKKIKYKYQKTKKWEDPNNMSWARAIFEEHEAKQNASTAEQTEPEPAMLHLVTRIKPVKGRPYWEKETIKNLKLLGNGKYGKMYISQVFKNTPEVNDMLRSVQHLLEIKPITFPHGLPKSEEDYEHCLLKDNGEFVVKHTILPKDLEKEVEIVDESPRKSVYDMQIETLTKANRKKVENYQVNSEYFKAKYTYEYNQDGKEFRYNGNDNIGPSNREWY